MTGSPDRPPQNVEIVTSIAPPNPDPSGIAVSKEGRVFLGFPRHADNHQQFSLAELKDGALIPFPSRDYVYPSKKPFNEWSVSPHGMTMDGNDVLWVLDDGKRAGIKEIPEGAAKVVGINISTGKIIASIVIGREAMGDDSHLNDLRVDLTHGEKGTVYIANSGFGARYSLVVVDIASGKSREVLLNLPCTSPEPGFVAFLEGQPKVFDPKRPTFPIGGADGIALGADSKKVYWTAISGRKLFSIPTAVLSDFQRSEAELEKAVVFEGEHPACDGLADNSEGNIYFGAFEQLSLVKRLPTGQFELLAHDTRFGWPDGLAYRNGWLYVTLGQWNRLPGFNDGKELRQPPFLVVRIRVDHQSQS
ncbi:MAG TPA: L-dopachrome tautomerase-related protein [Chthoniobacterales bacterium]